MPLYKRIWLISVFWGYSFLLSAQNFASTSSTIFKGKVLSSYSQWNENHTNIYTYYRVSVLQEIAGNLPASEITLQQIGGLVDQTAQITNLFIALNKGDETIFSVEKNKSNNYSFSLDTQKNKIIHAGTESVIDQRNNSNHSLSSLPAIDSIFPHIGYAGIQDTLTVFGKGFGNVQDTGKILFSNAYVGGLTYNVEPYAGQYIIWSDTLIKVLIPSNNASGLGSAGSGKIKIITAAGQALFSTDSLTIPYSCTNGISGGSVYIPSLIDANGNGGYAFSINNKLFLRDTITSTILRCIEKWQCATQVNFSIGSSSNISSTANDGINLITGDSLSSSLLGYTSIFFQNCSGNWYANDIDIVFNNSLSWNFGKGNPSNLQFDFETLLSQSLGFAHLLQNSNDSLSIMFWSLLKGKSKKNLTAWDIAGGTYNTQKSSSAIIGCSTFNMVQASACGVGFPLDARVISLEDPYSGFCHGTFPVKVKICNDGLNTIDSLTLNWSVNGVLQSPFNLSATLNHHDTTLLTIGNYPFNTAGTYQIKIWSSNPNHQPDDYPYSDTLNKSILINSCNTADAGVSAIYAPTNYICLGNNQVLVSLINHASTSLNVVQLNWKINGVLQTPVTWTGTLSAGMTAYGISMGNYNFTTPGNSIKVWSSFPNGINDLNPANDTANFNYTPVGLNGVYTVGGTSPNYTTLTAAINDINNKGICSDVTLNIRPGTYTGVFTISNSNSNHSKKLTIQSENGDSSSVIITSAQNTFNLSNVNWIHIQHLTITSTGDNNVFTISSSINNLEINNCSIMGAVYTNSFSNYNTLINIFPTLQSDTILIHNNLFQNGYSAISYSGSSFLSKNVVIQNNTITNFYQNAISVSQAKRPRIVGNNIQSLSGPGCLGIGFCDDGFEISKNSCVYKYGSGLYVNSFTATANQPAQIYNNTFSALDKSNHATNGIIFDNASYLDFFNNSVNIHGQTAITIIINDTTHYSRKLSFQNNIIVNSDTGYIYTLNSSSATPAQCFNLLSKNVYYINSVYPTFFDNIYVGSSTGTINFNEWQRVTQKDTTSIYKDPEYRSLQDLHIYPDTSNTSLNGFANPVSYITTDHDNQPRDPIAPDPGAYEFNLFSLDAGAAAFSQGVFCSGNNTVYASLKNYGSSTITAVSFGWSVNGIMQPIASLPSSINPQAVSAFLPLGNFNFMTAQTYTVRAWPVLLNGMADQNHINDTIYGVFTANGMSGNYTIGGSAPSYTSITAARNDLVLRGVCGPVVFDISPGTYAEQVSFPPINGSSSLNNITFRSSTGDSSSVLIQYSGTSNSQNSVIELAGGSFINIEKVSLSNTTGTTVLAIDNYSSNCRISNCAFNQTSLASVTTSQTSLCQYNIFENNLINGAIGIKGFNNFAYSISTWDNVYAKGIKLVNNVIKGTVYISMVQDILISHNVFNQSFQIEYSSDTIQMIQNEFAAGATLHECIAQPGNPIQVINNFSYVTSGNNVPFYFQAVQYASFFSNSIRVDSASNAPLAFVMIEDGTSDDRCIGITLKNNCIAVYNHSILILMGLNALVASSDYNNFYTNAPNLISSNGLLYPNLSNWQSLSGFDAHSLSYNPMYTSSTDLHLLNDYNLANKATPVSIVQVDIDGQARNSTAPDIGADEYSFSMFNLNIGTLAAKAIAPNCSGDSVFISVKNYGLVPVTSFTINGQINGTPLNSYNWSGSLNPGAKLWNLYIGTYNFVSSNTYTMQIWSQDPNGGTDGYAANDTTKIIFNYVPYVTTFLQPAHFCIGDSVSVAPQHNYQSYNWSTGATTQHITVNQQGWYTLMVKDSLGCIITDSTYVTQNALPVPPVITSSGSGLISSYTTNNQWYFNGSLIAGATGQSYVPNFLGNFTVMHTDSNGCSSTSTPFNTLGIISLNGTEIKFFPNPTTKYFYFTSNNASLIDASEIVVQDMQGDIVNIDIRIKDGNALLDFSSCTPGVYLIQLHVKDTINTIKLILIPD